MIHEKPRRGLKLLLTLAAAAMPAAAAAQASAMFGGDPQLTGVYRTAPAASLAGIRFTVQTDSPIRSNPAVAGGLLVFGSDDGFVHAVDARTGAERWRFRTGGAVRSSPAIVGGSVYVASRD